MAQAPSPLLSFDLFHRSMRRGATWLASALAVDDAGPPPPALRDWFDHYRKACLLHAEGEDTVLWPALLERRPDLSSMVATMEQEHSELERVLAALASALADPGEGGDVRALADGLVRVMESHLDDEERTAVAALVENLSDDLGDLIRQVQQNAGPQGAAIAVPFLLEHATADERASVVSALPPPVREGLAQWEPEYQRLLVERAATAA